MPESGDALRESLAALRLDRGEPAVRRRAPRWLVPGLVAVLVVGALGTYRLAARGAPAVQVASAIALGPGGVQGVPVISGAGYVVSAARYIAIGVRVAGRIDHYFVEEGDRVRAGDPLVQLDARDYEAAVTHAEATLGHARATADLKQKQVERARPLSRSGI